MTPAIIKISTSVNTNRPIALIRTTSIFGKSITKVIYIDHVLA